MIVILLILICICYYLGRKQKYKNTKVSLRNALHGLLCFSAQLLVTMLFGEVMDQWESEAQWEEVDHQGVGLEHYSPTLVPQMPTFLPPSFLPSLPPHHFSF